ncbi:MAG: hypothetical protein HN411_01445 [Waddliaceae bacterium]|jgi:hypothetical protein|nr:hypothetical protein [Waddliaceae bacterium]MBT3579351.1 hypothetical protein [Waddliaceae bacterium]MBT4444841.1 hypothetical protein [Waddliaceae bacterium]MBT6928023.1 hypothetical protein [Waddliaceae bacterium]MBT7264301.1 hypothetical protein [Waddliaceae bacterium]
MGIACSKSTAMLSVLLNRYSDDGSALLSFLPEEERSAVVDMSLDSDKAMAVANFSQEALFTMHYSWISDVISKIPEEIHGKIFSVLTDSQLRGLGMLLKRECKKELLPNKIRAFFIDYLFSFFDEEKNFPVEWLSSSELSSLLTCDKRMLVRVIDFLGLYDLAREVPLIVDRGVLKKVYSMLSPPQRRYLKRCSRDQDKATFPELNLRSWDGDTMKLRATLHRRGLMRLAFAVSEESPAFIWHLCHHLDIGRAVFIERSISKVVNSDVVASVRLQVHNIITFLRM